MNGLSKLYKQLESPGFNPEDLDTASWFKLKLTTDVVKTFMLCPTLRGIKFDFVDIYRISKVWEGSSEPTFELGVALWDSENNIKETEDFFAFQKGYKSTGIKDLDFAVYAYNFIIRDTNYLKHILPTFSTIDDAVNNKGITNIFSESNPSITFLPWKQYEEKVECIFDYLTAEPSHIKSLLDDNKTRIRFEYNFEDVNSTKNLEDQLLQFLGPKVYSLLLNDQIKNIEDKKPSATSKRKL